MIVYTRTVKAPVVTRRYSLVSQREIGLEPSFDEPVVVQRHARVTRVAPAAPRASAAAHRARQVPVRIVTSFPCYFVFLKLL